MRHFWVDRITSLEPRAFAEGVKCVALAEDAFTEAEQALQDGDLAGYADATERARDLISQALEAAGATASPEGGGAGEGGEGDTEAGAGG